LNRFQPTSLALSKFLRLFSYCLSTHGRPSGRPVQTAVKRVVVFRRRSDGPSAMTVARLQSVYLFIGLYTACYWRSTVVVNRAICWQKACTCRRPMLGFSVGLAHELAAENIHEFKVMLCMSTDSFDGVLCLCTLSYLAL